MITQKLYGTASATANGVASVIIAARSRLVGIQTAIRVDSITDNAYLNLEVSRASAREIAVNNAQQCIIEIALANNFVTSGLTMFGVNSFYPVNIQLTQGQIVYLHALITGTLTFDATFVFHLI